MRLLLMAIIGFVCQSAHALVVLQYHHVSDKTPKVTSVSPTLFREQMRYLEAQKFKIVDLAQVYTWLKSSQPLPQHAVAISFDDAYRSIYKEAFPELKRRGWPFTVFINSKAHDEKNPLYASWDELREMSKSGAVVGNHTDSHPHLIRQQGYESYSQWLIRREKEIGFAQKRIQAMLGQNHKIFAYPYGEYDRVLKDYLKEQGYIAFGQHSGPLARNSDPQALPRFPIGGAYGQLDDFAMKVNSLPFPNARIKVTTETGSVLRQPELPRGVARPILRIASPMMAYLAEVSCYAKGQGRIHAEVKGGVLVAQARRDLPPGRSRYNCTALAGGGRYFWFSRLFIRRTANGQWMNE